MSKSRDTWWAAVGQLSASQRFVAHEPETPRYARARQKLRLVLRTGEYLGCLNPSDADHLMEIAVWSPPERRGAGYYCCFRLFLDDGMVTSAVMFAFYDGTESSPGLSTIEEARAFAQANGFVEE